MLTIALLAIFGIALAGFFLARGQALKVAVGSIEGLHSRPNYHGYFTLLTVLLIGLLAYVVTNSFGFWYLG